MKKVKFLLLLFCLWLGISSCNAQEFMGVYSRCTDSIFFVSLSEFNEGLIFSAQTRSQQLVCKKATEKVEFNLDRHFLVSRRYSTTGNALLSEGFYFLQFNNKYDTVVFNKGIDEFDTIVPIFDAVRDGEWNYYSKNGTLCKKENYIQGTLVTTYEITKKGNMVVVRKKRCKR